MKQEKIGISFGQAIAQMLSSKIEGIKPALTFVFGFVISSASLFEGMSPFGVALVAAAPRKYLIQTAIGSCLAYLLPGIIGGSMKYFVAILAVAGIKIFFTKLDDIESKVIWIPAISFVIMMSLSMFMMQSQEINLYTIAFSLAEAIISGSVSYFFITVFILYDKGITAISEKKDMISVAMFICVSLMALTKFEIKGYSIGRIVAIVIILICAYKGGAGFGSMAGVLAGVSIGISDPNLLYVTATYAFAGLISGLFASFDRLFVAICFVVINGMVAIVSSQDSTMIKALFEVMGASVLFMLLPQKLLLAFNFGKVFDGVGSKGKYDNRDIAVNKLSFASSAMKDVSEAVEVVSEKLSERDNNDISSIFLDASHIVCKRCGLKNFCWEKSYQSTMSAMNDIINVLRVNGKVVKEDFPTHFTQKCVQMPELVEQINRNYYKFNSKENAKRRISEIRSIVAEQFQGMSEYLLQLSREFEEAYNVDMSAANKIRNYFERFNVMPTSVNCVLDRYMRMSVEITIPTDEIRSVNKKRICIDLSELCDKIFDLPSVDSAGRITKISLCEKASYTVDFGTYQMAYGEGKFCGDTTDSFLDLKGMAHMILSDGMGSGPNAAVDSAMASSLSTRLIKAGFNFESALKMVNSALLVKSVDESLATVDITTIDLYSGSVMIIKAGAAPTFIRRSGKAFMIEGDSLPIGILKGVELFKKSTTLKENDIILMVSDGVTYTGEEWVLSEIENYTGDNMDELSERICDQAKKRRIDGHDDDVTAMACIIKKGV